MGFDIIGRRPANVDGRYFGANISAWPPMLRLIRTAIDEARLGFNTTTWAYNSEAGLAHQGQCDALADAMERALAAHPELLEPEEELSPRETEFMRQLAPLMPIMSPHQRASGAWREYVGDFIRFLRNCGGFCIF